MINLDLNLPSSSISQDELNDILTRISSNATNITNLTSKYNSGISTIATKVTQCGVSTAGNAAPSTISANIQTIYTNRYNAGITDGRVGYYTQAQYNQYGTDRYNAGVTAADARVNANSANYKGGYNAGVTAADGRVNANSANYKGGYNAGVTAGVNEGKVRTIRVTAGDGLYIPGNIDSKDFYVCAVCCDGLIGGSARDVLFMWATSLEGMYNNNNIVNYNGILAISGNLSTFTYKDYNSGFTALSDNNDYYYRFINNVSSNSTRYFYAYWVHK